MGRRSIQHSHGSHLRSTAGTKHDDIIKAGKGAAALYGRAGDDILIGSKHIDGLIGGPGDDILKGGRGADVMVGGAGNDILIGGLGRHGDANEDTFRGGAGTNLYIASDGRDAFYFDGGYNVVRGADHLDDVVVIRRYTYFADAANAVAIYDQATGVLSLQQDGADAGSPVKIIGQFTPGFDLSDSHIFFA